MTRGSLSDECTLIEFGLSSFAFREYNLLWLPRVISFAHAGLGKS
jgi:hypothetical protein